MRYQTGVNRWLNAGWLLAATSDKLSETEFRTQMSLWALFSSPLIFSSDSKNLKNKNLSVLQNKDVIAIQQDFIGKSPTLLKLNTDTEVYLKELSNGSFALGILNKSNKKQSVNLQLANVGITGSFSMKNVWENGEGKTVSGSISSEIESHELKLFVLNPIQ